MLQNFKNLSNPFKFIYVAVGLFYPMLVAFIYLFFIQNQFIYCKTDQSFSSSCLFLKNESSFADYYCVSSDHCTNVTAFVIMNRVLVIVAFIVELILSFFLLRNINEE